MNISKVKLLVKTREAFIPVHSVCRQDEASDEPSRALSRFGLFEFKYVKVILLIGCISGSILFQSGRKEMDLWELQDK